MARPPSRAQRQREARIQLRLRDQHVKRLQTRLAAEFSAAARAAGQAYPAWQPILLSHRRRLLEILTGSIRTAGLAAAHHLREHVRKAGPGVEWESKRGVNPTEEEIDADILLALKGRAIYAADASRDLTERRIKTQIRQGLQANETYADIGRRIAENVSDMSNAMGLTVARTEIGIASATAEQAEMTATQAALGVAVYKIWTAAHDDRTRESHAEADGQEAKLDQPFSVGGAELLHPCDPAGPPGEVINCRCVCRYDYRHED